MAKTKIEWCDKVFNPVTGCTPISAGCANCYARRIAERFWGDRKFSDVQCHEDRLDIPSTWKKPQTIFVNSMSDLFHENVPTEFILTVFYRMFQYSQHTFIALTKRPERMVAFFEEWDKSIDRFKKMAIPFVIPPLKNVILGVSVEDQPSADLRIPLLLQTPAAKRMVSVEPMLGEIDLTCLCSKIFPYTEMCALTGWAASGKAEDPVQHFGLTKLDWVVCGCESGPRRRPCNLDWMRSLRDQCLATGTPFFLKQAEIDGKLVKMPMLDGHVWDQKPEGM